MGGSLTLRGSLEVDGGCVSGCGSGGLDRHVIGLALGQCGNALYESIVETAKPLRISTPGLIGTQWEDVPLLESLTAIEFLFVQSDAPLAIRIGAAPATLLGAGGVYPTLFAGGETLTFEVDAVAIAVAFLVGDQTAAQVAARINAAVALAGIFSEVASVDASGQLRLTGVLTGAQGEVTITGGSGRATLGLPLTTVTGAGSDITVQGIYMSEFQRAPSAPTRIQFSGVAGVKILAAGRSS